MSYQPDLYDVVTPPAVQGDVHWYRERARSSGEPVLELGAGTGRITLAIAASGIAIHALDSDAAMLERLRGKLASAPADVRARVTVVPGDMRTFDLAERFALIICPYRAFLHNVTEADRVACLSKVRQHLRPSGRFLFNVFHPSLSFMAQHSGASRVSGGGPAHTPCRPAAGSCNPTRIGTTRSPRSSIRCIATTSSEQPARSNARRCFDCNWLTSTRRIFDGCSNPPGSGPLPSRVVSTGESSPMMARN